MGIHSINGRTIKTHRGYFGSYKWSAYDDNSYDGVSDGDTRCGLGHTQYAAIVDLLELYDEEMPEEDALKFEDSPAWKAANGQFGVGS